MSSNSRGTAKEESLSSKSLSKVCDPTMLIIFANHSTALQASGFMLWVQRHCTDAHVEKQHPQGTMAVLLRVLATIVQQNNLLLLMLCLQSLQTRSQSYRRLR